MSRISKRESCAICNDIIIVGFKVSNELWDECVKLFYQNSCVCLGCFARVADEKLLAWEKGIQLYPISLRTHMDSTSTSANVVGPSAADAATENEERANP